MAFTPTSISSPLTTITVLIADDDTSRMEINPITWAIVQAQEQLHLVMEAKWAEDLWQWMEKGWENWMAKWDLVVVSDKDLAVMEAKVAVVVISMKCQKVSFQISSVMFGF